VFSDEFLDKCRDLANMLVVRTGRESDPHWNEAAELVLTGFIAFIVACEPNPAERNLQTLRMLVSSREKFAAAVEAMQRVEAFGGVISRLGGLLSWFVDKELSSVLTTVQRHSAFLDSPAIARVTSSSSFDPRMLRTETGATLYLCLPPDKLVTLAPLSRMWIGTVLRSVSTCGMGERNPVLFLLDEAAHLGKIQVLEDAVTLMRGMGVRLWFFFQSLQQLQKCYGEQAAVMLDNIDTQQYFGINSYESAEAVSKRIGDTTIAVKSVNRTTSYSKPVAVYGEPRQAGSVSHGQSVNTAPLGRRLLKPEEIIALPEDMALILHRNLPVIPATLPKYYNAPEFAQFMGVKPVWRLQFSMPPWALAFGKALLLNCGLVGALVLLAYLSEHDFSLEKVRQDLGLPQAASPSGLNAPPFNQPVYGNEGSFTPPSLYGPYQTPSTPYDPRFDGAGPRVPDPY
jgi:type IV secretion system protein VirD4